MMEEQERLRQEREREDAQGRQKEEEEKRREAEQNRRDEVIDIEPLAKEVFVFDVDGDRKEWSMF